MSPTFSHHAIKAMTDNMATVAMMVMLDTVTMKAMKVVKATKATKATKAVKAVKAMIAMKALMGIGKSDSILIPGSRELMENSWAVA